MLQYTSTSCMVAWGELLFSIQCWLGRVLRSHFKLWLCYWHIWPTSSELSDPLVEPSLSCLNVFFCPIFVLTAPPILVGPQTCFKQYNMYLTLRSPSVHWAKVPHSTSSSRVVDMCHHWGAQIASNVPAIAGCPTLNSDANMNNNRVEEIAWVMVCFITVTTDTQMGSESTTGKNKCLGIKLPVFLLSEAHSLAPINYMTSTTGLHSCVVLPAPSPLNCHLRWHCIEYLIWLVNLLKTSNDN